MERLLQWALRHVLHRGIDIAMNKGADHLLGPGKTKAEMTPEERQQAKAGRDAARRLRQGLKFGRRLW
mgnify:FL=1